MKIWRETGGRLLTLFFWLLHFKIEIFEFVDYFFNFKIWNIFAQNIFSVFILCFIFSFSHRFSLLYFEFDFWFLLKLFFSLYSSSVISWSWYLTCHSQFNIYCQYLNMFFNFLQLHSLIVVMLIFRLFLHEVLFNFKYFSSTIWFYVLCFIDLFHQKTYYWPKLLMSTLKWMPKLFLSFFLSFKIFFSLI